MLDKIDVIVEKIRMSYSAIPSLKKVFTKSNYMKSSPSIVRFDSKIDIAKPRKTIASGKNFQLVQGLNFQHKRTMIAKPKHIMYSKSEKFGMSLGNVKLNSDLGSVSSLDDNNTVEIPVSPLSKLPEDAKAVKTASKLTKNINFTQMLIKQILIQMQKSDVDDSIQNTRKMSPNSKMKRKEEQEKK